MHTGMQRCPFEPASVTSQLRPGRDRASADKGQGHALQVSAAQLHGPAGQTALVLLPPRHAGAPQTRLAGSATMPPQALSQGDSNAASPGAHCRRPWRWSRAATRGSTQPLAATTRLRSRAACRSQPGTWACHDSVVTRLLTWRIAKQLPRGCFHGTRGFAADTRKEWRASVREVSRPAQDAWLSLPLPSLSASMCCS